MTENVEMTKSVGSLPLVEMTEELVEMTGKKVEMTK